MTTTSTFGSNDGHGYELQMGRWSRRLAPSFIAFAGTTGPVRVLDVGCGTGNVSMCLAILVGAWLAWAGERRPGVAEVALVMVAIVLMTGKSFPVQASVWLVPLVALVGIQWRDHLVWSGAEALHFGAVWLYLAGSSVPDRGLPSGWYLLLLRG